MHNRIKTFSILFIVLLIAFLPLLLFAQDTGGDPADQFKEAFATFTSLAGLIVVITAFIRKVIDVGGFWAQYLSWVVAVVLGFIGMALNWGIFNNIIWYIGLVYALGAAGLANGMYDWQFLQFLLRLLKLLPKSAILQLSKK